MEGLKQAAGGEWLDRTVRSALLEDLGTRGDITCAATVPEALQGSARLVAKEKGVVAGIDWAIRTGELAEPGADWTFSVQDGDPVDVGQVIAKVSGSMRGILISERTALNGLGRLSGMATYAARAMKAVEGTRAVVVDTRKTTPGWRMAEKYAVRCGGAGNHRIGLFDEILIKENHIRAAGGVAEAIVASRKWREREGDHTPIEVEVTSLEELDIAVEAAPDRILLDNFPDEDLAQAVKRYGDRMVLEASGGITLDSLSRVAGTGVHRISLGAMTHSMRPLDLSLLVSSIDPND